MLNKLMVIGNVGTEPEMRYTPNGTAVTSFRLATTRSWKGEDGKKNEETEWFTCVTWNSLAEQVNEYLSKGRRVYAEGRLHSVEYDGSDGQRRFRNELVADRVVFLDRGEKHEQEQVASGTADDLPF